MFTAMGFIREGAILLPTQSPLASDSVTCGFLWHGVDAMAVKSPVSKVAGVMEKPCESPGFDRLIVDCSPTKKNSLFF